MECSGRTQVSADDLIDASPQRIDFGHGKVRITIGRMSASTSTAGLPGFSVSAM